MKVAELFVSNEPEEPKVKFPAKKWIIWEVLVFWGVGASGSVIIKTNFSPSKLAGSSAVMK